MIERQFNNDKEYRQFVRVLEAKNIYFITVSKPFDIPIILKHISQN